MVENVTYERLCKVIEEHYRDWHPPLGFDHDKDRHMKVSGPWIPAFLSLMWLTGGRVSEVLAVRGMDIEVKEDNDIQWAKITLPNLKQRGRASKKVIVTIMNEYPKLWEYIDRYHAELYNPEGLMFPRDRRTAWYHCKKLFNEGTHKVGRHSWVMNQARHDAPLLHIKQQGGWSNLNSMNAYIHEFGVREIVDGQMDRFKKQGGNQ